MALYIKLNFSLCLILLTLQTTLSLPVVLNETTIDEKLNDSLSSPNKVEDYNAIDNELTNFGSDVIKCSYELQDKNKNDNDTLNHSNELEGNNEIDKESNKLEKNNEIKSVLNDGKNNTLELLDNSEENNGSDSESIGFEIPSQFKPIPYGNDGLNYPNPEEQGNVIEAELIDVNNTLDHLNKSEVESNASDIELIFFGKKNEPEQSSEMYIKLVDDGDNKRESLTKSENHNASDKLQDKNENEHDISNNSNEVEENNEIDSESTFFGSKKLNEIKSVLKDGKNIKLELLENSEESNASDSGSEGYWKEIFKTIPYGNDGSNCEIYNEPILVGKKFVVSEQTRENPKFTTVRIYYHFGKDIFTSAK